MNWSARWTWLMALREQRPFRSADADPADMGTAFGLDASFDSAPTMPPGHALPSSDPAPWESRLIRRSGL